MKKSLNFNNEDIKNINNNKILYTIVQFYFDAPDGSFQASVCEDILEFLKSEYDNTEYQHDSKIIDDNKLNFNNISLRVNLNYFYIVLPKPYISWENTIQKIETILKKIKSAGIELRINRINLWYTEFHTDVKIFSHIINFNIPQVNSESVIENDRHLILNLTSKNDSYQLKVDCINNYTIIVNNEKIKGSKLEIITTAKLDEEKFDIKYLLNKLNSMHKKHKEVLFNDILKKEYVEKILEKE